MNPGTLYKVELSSGLVVLDTEQISTLTDNVHTVLECKDLESIGRGANYAGATHSEAWEYDDDYVLANDIDCSLTHDATIYGDDGFDPIGEWVDTNENKGEESFEIESLSGSLDGRGYKISDLYIYQPDRYYVGLVKLLESDGKIDNIGLEDAEIKGLSNVGGLLGYNSGEISNSYYLGNVSGFLEVGGLVGTNRNEILNSYFSGNVSGSDHVGGFVGINSGNISNSYSTGAVKGNQQVGGLVGTDYYASISNSYSTSNTNGGSLVGEMYGDASILNSFATGDSKDGLVSHDYDEYFSTVSNSYQYIDATCTDTCSDYPTISTTQLNDKTWYQNTLLFDNNFNLNNIDQGYYPHVMNTDHINAIPNQENIALP